jgi:outer membrane protein assembly factor BamB
VYVDSLAGVSKIDAKTGDVLWNDPFESTSAARVAVADGIVYDSNSVDGAVVALSAQDGTPLWHTKADGESYDVPYTVNGVVYVGEASLQGSNGPASANGMLALNARTGMTLWKHQLSYYWGYDDFAVGGGVIYVTTSDGALSALNANDGSLFWSTQYAPRPQLPSGLVTLAP